MTSIRRSSHCRRCSHCRQIGHNIRTCPQRLNTQIVVQPPHPPPPQERTIEFINENSYSVCVFWSRNLIGPVRSIDLKYLTNVNGNEMFPMKFYNIHRVVVIPLEQINNRPYTINIDNDFTIDEIENIKILVDINIVDIEISSPIIFINKTEYTMNKKLIDQWKECGLKSMFLLKELDRLGARKYENLEPIIDMVQDIKIPDHTEADKEIAGVPNVFTNLT